MSDAELATTFNGWLVTLPGDVGGVEKVPNPEARSYLLGGLGYLLRKIDLVPDYLPGVGIVDDTFVLRASAVLALDAGLGDADPAIRDQIEELAEDAWVVEGFLGALSRRFYLYVEKQPFAKYNGRTILDILGDPVAYRAFLHDVQVFRATYVPQRISARSGALATILSYIERGLTSN